MNKSKAKTKVPRNFLLLDCLNKTINYTNVAYGLVDECEDDERYKNNYTKMEYWTGTLMFDDGDSVNIFDLLFTCTKDFPKERPMVEFTKQSLEYIKIKKICDADGHLNETAIKIVKWDENMSIGDYLTNILNVVTNGYY